MSSIRFRIAVFSLSSFFACGCEAINAPHAAGPAKPVVSAISTEDVLDRCVAAYSQINTLRVSGVFRDNRQGEHQISPISWEIQRPDKCRVKIGPNEAVVAGKGCWDYDTQRRAFKSMNIPSRTPMETASYRISRGVSFPLPAVLERDEGAFGRSRVRGYVDWRLTGMAWIDDHPCYVVSRRETAGGRDATRRLWIDQDSYLIRAWDLVEGEGFGRDSVIVAETCHEVALNPSIAQTRFNVSVITPEDVKPEQPQEGQIDGDDQR